jgi:hypothetical protein
LSAAAWARPATRPASASNAAADGNSRRKLAVYGMTVTGGEPERPSYPFFLGAIRRKELKVDHYPLYIFFTN